MIARSWPFAKMENTRNEQNFLNSYFRGLFESFRRIFKSLLTEIESAKKQKRAGLDGISIESPRAPVKVSFSLSVTF